MPDKTMSDNTSNNMNNTKIIKRPEDIVPHPDSAAILSQIADHVSSRLANLEVLRVQDSVPSPAF